MSQSEIFRRKAETLLSEAANAPNLKDRSRLIDEALYWHHLALDAAGHPDQRMHDNDDMSDLDIEARSSGG
ncbi:MAG TPA: hypothetical protein VGC92_13045 [Phenylobacterium sp.]|jgi:hypothetical protein